jgi:hypothetical protein
MACKRSGVRIPIAPHISPVQMRLWDRLADSRRSLDRHLTVVLGTFIEQRAPRIGTPRHAGQAGLRRSLNMFGRLSGVREPSGWPGCRGCRRGWRDRPGSPLAGDGKLNARSPAWSGCRRRRDRLAGEPCRVQAWVLRPAPGDSDMANDVSGMARTTGPASAQAGVTCPRDWRAAAGWETATGPAPGHAQPGRSDRRLTPASRKGPGSA